MKDILNLIQKPVLIAVALNILLPMLLAPYANADEINPPNGPNQLSMKGQFMHMMVHHNKVLLTSSAIVGLVVFLAVSIGYKLKPVGRFM